jgi:hypothetical protein
MGHGYVEMDDLSLKDQTGCEYMKDYEGIGMKVF